MLDLTAQLPMKPGPALPPTRPVRRIHKLDSRVDGELIARLVAEYEAGTPSTELMGMFGLSKASVLKLLREAGAEIRRQGLDEAGIQTAIQLYQSGLSLKKVGERLGVDGETVRLALEERGVPRRSRHG